MTARTRGLLVALSLALATPALAHDPEPGASTPRTPDVAPLIRLDDGSIDVRARVRSIPGGLALELAGTLVELRFTDGVPAVGDPRPPGGRELRATLSVDGQTRGVVLRLVPPPAPGDGSATP